MLKNHIILYFHCTNVPLDHLPSKTDFTKLLMYMLMYILMYMLMYMLLTGLRTKYSYNQETLEEEVEF